MTKTLVTFIGMTHKEYSIKYWVKSLIQWKTNLGAKSTSLWLKALENYTIHWNDSDELWEG